LQLQKQAKVRVDTPALAPRAMQQQTAQSIYLFCSPQGIMAGTTTVAFTMFVFITAGAIFSIATA